MAEKERDATERGGGSNPGGIFGGLSDLIEKLGELAEKGGELTRAGEFSGEEAEKVMKGVYGFSVKVGLGGEGVRVEPFGNIHKDETTGQSVVEEVREPMVDVFEEKGYVRVVAEMAGIGAEDVRLDIKDDLLIIYAEREDKKYRKEVLLPESFAREKMDISCNNGILEIRCKR